MFRSRVVTRISGETGLVPVLGRTVSAERGVMASAEPRVVLEAGDTTARQCRGAGRLVAMWRQQPVSMSPHQ